MMPNEKDQLLAFFEEPSKWCRNAEARDTAGAPVPYDDPSAVAWDVTGALCRLFGWPRACVLFEQLHRQIYGPQAKANWPPPDLEMQAMAGLQAFNDGPTTTFESLRTKLESVPAWRGPGHSRAS